MATKENDGYIDAQLRKAISIKSTPKNKIEVEKMLEWVGDQLKQYANKTKHTHNITYHKIPGTKKKNGKLSPVLTCEIGHDPDLMTLLVYGYVDVRFAADRKKSSRHNSFNLTKKFGQLYGQGVSDSKGPIVAFLCALDVIANLKTTFKEDNHKINVNLKFLFEGMGEDGNIGVRKLLYSMKDSDFLRNVDFVTALSPPGMDHPLHYNYEEARQAIKKVYGPSAGRYLIREGGPIHVIDILQKITGKHVISFPIGPEDDYKHNSYHDERLSVKNFIDGISVYVTYLLGLGNLYISPKMYSRKHIIISIMNI